jgi:hypothetical protein
MNKIPESEALKMQVILKETTDKLNLVYSECGFIPPDSEVGNRDTCINEMKKKKSPRVEFIVEMHGKKVTLKVKKDVTPEKNYEEFLKELAKNKLYTTLTEECGKKVAEITGKPLPGVVSKKIEVVTQEAPALVSLNTSLKAVGAEAQKDAKDAAKKASEQSPSVALNVVGAAGNKAAEKLVQQNTAASTAKQNEATKAGTDKK